MIIQQVTIPGMIRQGDFLLLREKGKKEVFPVTAKKILNGGTDTEEIIFSIARNRYFILNMMLNGDSWIEECSIVEDGKIYSVSNSTEVLPYG